MSAALAPRPANDGWNKHFGHEDRPVPADTQIYARYRNGRIVGPIRADSRRWRIWPASPSAWDIVAWRRAEEESSQ